MLRFAALHALWIVGASLHKSDEGASHSMTMALLCFFVVILKILICIGPRPTMYQNQNQNVNLFDPHTIYIIAMLTSFLLPIL